MRFNKGDKVEVMNNKEVPVSWRNAEILNCGGHTYHVRYDFYPATASDQTVETVARKYIRPLPPLVRYPESYYAGDIVEVFYENSWKVAVVLKLLKIRHRVAAPQHRQLVRLIGSSQELIVDRLNIRMRQTWHDEKWTLMEKSTELSNDLISSKPATSNSFRIKNFRVSQFNERVKYRPKNDCMNNQKDAALWESPLVSTRALKRTSPYNSSIVEAHNGHARKLRAVEKEGQKRRMVAATEIEKVDAVAYPVLGGKNMHASFNAISYGYNQTERAKQNDSVVRSAELDSIDSDACSVGSCSVTNQSLKNCYSHFIPASYESETLCSDAESSTSSGFERSSTCLPKEDVEVSIHRLELHAYHSTLKALFASGPLSWDQEALLTNLRIMLHISNDEHLKELKHLISTKTTVSVK